MIVDLWSTKCILWQYHLTLSAYRDMPLYHVTAQQIDGLVQKRRNSIANTLELRLSCTNPSKYGIVTVTMLEWIDHVIIILHYITLCYTIIKYNVTSYIFVVVVIG